MKVESNKVNTLAGEMAGALTENDAKLRDV